MAKLARTRWCLVWCLWLGVTAAVSAEPPTVIRTVPEHGATNVDPGLEKIVVEFNQPMNRRGRSIVGGGERFPEITDTPRWTNARTLEIPVKLKAEHSYWMSFNNQSFRNFTSKKGESAVPYPLQFRTRAVDESAGAGLDPKANTAAVLALRQAIDRSYSYRDRLDVDWDAVFTRNRAALRSAKTPAEFAEIACNMLAVAKDKHVWLDTDNGQRFASFVDPPVGNIDTSNLSKWVPGLQEVSPAVTTGRFDGGVGYLMISSLNGQQLQWYHPLYEWLWDYPDAPGLVIDLRANGGGSENVALEFVGCLIDEPALYAKHVFRDPSQSSGFTPVQERWVRPNKLRPRYRGPIAVLSGPRTVSSAEAFLLMMKQVPGAKVFGSTSQGSSGNPRPHELGNGVTVYLPSWKAMTPGGEFFEGVGIAPDVEVAARPQDFRTSDPVLEAALAWLRGTR